MSEMETVFAHECAACIKDDSMRIGETVKLESTKSEASKRNVGEVVVTNSKSKVVIIGFRTIMRSLSKGSINIDPQNFAMSIMDDRILVNVMVSRTMHTAKDARPAYELMHTMGGRPTVKDGLEHMSLDVWGEGGGRKIHKEIGPVEVGCCHL